MGQRVRHKKSISRKLTWLIVRISGVALMAATIALIVNFVGSVRSSKVTQITSIAEILASNSTAAIEFEQTEIADELLASLADRKTIQLACLYSSDGELFANWPKEYQGKLPSVPASAGHEFNDNGFLQVNVPVTIGGERVGTILMRDNMSDLNAQIVRSVLIITAVMVVSLLIAAVLATKLQRIISKPILELAETAEQICSKGDYSLRMTKIEDDEIGALYEQFNEMLDRIERSDHELRKAHHAVQRTNDQLEFRVRQRTEELSETNGRLRLEMREREKANTELRQSEAQVRAIVETASDGIIAFDEEGTLASCNTAAAAMFEFDINELLTHDVNSLFASQGNVEPLEKLKRIADAHKGHHELRGMRASEEEFPAEISIRKITLADRRLYTAFMRDLTDHKEAERRLSEMNQELIEASRKAGMADVANGVLHNVGNVLNSVNVSASLVAERVKNLRIEGIRSAAKLMQDQGDKLGDFFNSDERGQRLPEYLGRLGEHLGKERDSTVGEIDALIDNVEHIKEIVRSQQSYAGVSGVIEEIALDELIDDAMRFVTSSFSRHGIEIIKEYEDDIPRIEVDKAKLLQILVNLIKNAKESVIEAAKPQKRVAIRIGAGEHGYVAIEVEDNGVGIAKDKLTTIFSHGFTTKQNGHGFGLHSSANAATELNGSLSVSSDGLGEGATFLIELPLISGVPKPAVA